MFQSHIGEFAALFTAFCWTATALAFESASHKVGSIPVNLIRLLMAMLFLSIYTFLSRGFILPFDASQSTWFWLSLSGLVGLVMGDLFLFKSYTILGSRISLLIMTLVPPMTSAVGWFVLDERLTLFNAIGMILTLSGIAIVILTRKDGQKGFSIAHSAKGLFFTFMGAIGQTVGIIFSKLGMGDYNAFSATQIRILAGIVGFIILITVLKKWNGVARAFKHKVAMQHLTVGSFFGPFLGISFSLVAIQHTSTGIASTIMSITPILIIPPAILIMKQKTSTKEVVGAIISVLGVALFFI